MRYDLAIRVIISCLLCACGDPKTDKVSSKKAERIETPLPADVSSENVQAETDTSQNISVKNFDNQIIKEPSLAEQIAIFTEVSGSTRLEQNWLSRLDPTVLDEAEPKNNNDALSLWRWRSSKIRSQDRAKRLLAKTRLDQRHKARRIIVTLSTYLGHGSDRRFYNEEDEEIELKDLRLGTDVKIIDSQYNPLSFSWDNGAQHAYIPITKDDLEEFLQKASKGSQTRSGTNITLRLSLDLISAVELSSDRGRFRVNLNQIEVLAENNSVLWSSNKID